MRVTRLKTLHRISDSITTIGILHILEKIMLMNLIVTFQPSLILNSGVHHSLHSFCHQQIVFAKLNLLSHPRNAKFGIAKTLMLILWDKYLKNLGEKEPWQI